MIRKAVSGIMFPLLLISSLILVFNVQPVSTGNTIYIRPDGSVDPPTAPIQRDGDIYTFTDNINHSIVVERNNIIVDGNGHMLEGSGSGTGIDLSRRANVMVRNTQIKNFTYGMRLEGSSNNNISGNNIANNECGINLEYYSSSNNISGNNIANNEYGISFLSSSNNTISGNSITANNGAGIWLYFSSNNIISGNTFINDGLAVKNSFLSSVVNNSVNGKPLVYLEGAADYSVGDAGQVILVECDRIRVENLNLSSTDIGVQLWRTRNSVISGNIITANNLYGIWLAWGSSNNIISGNIIANNECGINLEYYSSSNIISGNNITANNDEGICLDHSSNDNIISENNVANNWCGIWVYSSSNNTISGNNITANNYCGIMVYSSSNNNISGNIITANNFGGIDLGFSSNNIISENKIANSYLYGIGLHSSSNITISGNSITANNYYGIYLSHSSNNTIISGNIITANNYYGIRVYSSSNNIFYHNDFIDNSQQVDSSDSINVWDDGYPSGGNYWSDYTDMDLYSGPYQNETGGDDIWDHPYVIDENNTDRYPHVNPWTLTPPTLLPSTIRVKRLNLHRIDTVDFKMYVKRVLPHEWIAGWPIDSLKAGAMAAKTYAWYWIEQGGRHPPNADVCDGQHCQRYKEETNPKTDIAVEATWPIGIRKDGKLFESAYWDGLVVVDYTGGAELKIRSSPEIRDENVITVVPEGAKLAVVNNTPVLADGFHWWDVVTDSGEGVRGWAAGKYLRSRWPTYPGETLNEYAVRHNLAVRMSQYGSMYLAKQGWDFRQILSYYYPSTEFFDTWGISESVEPDPLPAQAAELARTVIGAEYCHGKGWNWTLTLDGEGKPKSWTWKGGRFLTADEIKNGYWYVYSYYNETTKKWEDKVEYGDGLDCSGVVVWSYNKAYGATNYVNPANPIFYEGAYQQYWLNCLPLKKEELLPGDLLFFDTADPENPDHVAMYVGGPFQFAYGEGKVFIYNTVESTIWGDEIVTVAFYNSTSETLTTLKPSTGENRTLHVSYYGRVTDHNKKGTKIVAKSPVDLNVTDPDGNVLTKEIGEIAGMFYVECDVSGDGVLDDVTVMSEIKLGEYLIVVTPAPEALPTDTYTLEAWGDATISLAENVSISDIPTEPYTLNSTALDIPPTTLLDIGEPKFVVDNATYLTSTTPIALIAEDNPGGSGVASTLYRIHNATYDSDWIIYVQPFYLTELSDSTYSIDYYSTDYLENIETTNTATVILKNPNVAITNVNSSKNVVGQGYFMNITLIVENRGYFTESFNVSVFYDETAITLPNGKNHTTTTLTSGNSTTLTIPWNTTGTAKGNYTIKAKATPLPEETDTTDNTLTDGAVLITIPGDVNGDRTCDMKDIYQLIRHFMCEVGDPCYVANYDINCDGTINMKDIYIAIRHFTQSW